MSDKPSRQSRVRPFTLTARFFSSSGSSLLADFIHTAALFVIILFFMFNVFCSNAKIGSIERMYEGLQQAAIDYPIEGNRDGSYLTFRSKSGLSQSLCRAERARGKIEH